MILKQSRGQSWGQTEASKMGSWGHNVDELLSKGGLDSVWDRDPMKAIQGMMIQEGVYEAGGSFTVSACFRLTYTSPQNP